jgi:hypothetical protein
VIEEKVDESKSSEPENPHLAALLRARQRESARASRWTGSRSY